MRSSGGETPQVKGRRYDEKCHMLLEELGYRTVLRHDHGFDMVGDPPKEHTHFIRPIFVPPNRTAFEFKSGTEVALRREAKKLRKKVTNAKHRKIPSLKRIRTCILVVETLVAERTKRSIFADFAVYVWDWPIVLFLAAKVSKMVSFSKPDRKIKEQKLDPSTTFLQVVNPYKNALKFSVSIFYQRLFKQLDIETFQSTIEALTRILHKSADELDLRGYVTLETYSISGITDDCLESYKKVLEEMSAGRIIYEIRFAKIYAFDSASWSFLLA
jgi:hypothetical protein